MIIKRQLYDRVTDNLFKGKIIIIYGGRRVGKTTLIKEIVEKHVSSKYINCELFQYKSILENTDSNVLKNFIGDIKLLVLDEAQSINNIGLVLKILHDTFPEIQIIATGSSSFDLANKTSEPLTGRSRQYILYPLFVNEILTVTDKISIISNIDKILRFGMYPEVYLFTEQDAIEELNNITSNYLYKDILQLDNIKKSNILINLLKLLALQIGNEVSLNELSNHLNVHINTVSRYLDLLEKTFVIFSLSSFNRNLRKEIGKKQKIYFYDLGIRNTLIQNFNTLDTREDVGSLWENFCILERMKLNHYNRRFVNSYFWRTYDQKEIDYIEEIGGKLHAFEFKYSKIKTKFPKDFINTYHDSTFDTISKDNIFNSLLKEMQ